VSAVRVVAVVVTFNRLPLLQRLVARLREVSEVAEILVVDNASGDGTGEWLIAEGVEHRTLPENRGGAGGFHEGLAWAMERGADLVWLMDDDGMPERDCLATLLTRADLDFWGPAVLAEQDPDRLCFPIRLPGGTGVVHRMADVEAAAEDGLIRDVVIPFNGVLVTKELSRRSGCLAPSSSSGATTWSTSGGPSVPAPASAPWSTRTSCTPPPTTWARR
jgi:rhamnopyranosyl-N-acetylglucosaminyl-diphospho-decaprenol beta-1,3/1,4-galactofuranosyltransferase